MERGQEADPTQEVDRGTSPDARSSRIDDVIERLGARDPGRSEPTADTSDAQPGASAASERSSLDPTNGVRTRIESAIGSPLEIAPWGRATTPLLPLPLREHLGVRSAPRALCAFAGRDVQLKELDATFWTHMRGSAPPDVLLELSQVVSGVTRDLEDVTAIAHSAPLEAVDLRKLPLRVRTSNALGRSGFVGAPQALRGVTFGTLLGMRQFGVRSLLDLLCVLEAFSEFVASTGKVPREALAMAYRDPAGDVTAPTPLSPLVDLDPMFREIASWAVGEHGLRSLGDVLMLTAEDVPPEIQHAWDRIKGLPLESLADERVERYSAPTSLRDFMERLDERESTILLERVLARTAPPTLDALGKRFADVTRERVRQLERRVRDALEDPLALGPLKRRARGVRRSLGAAVPLEAAGLTELRAETTADFPIESDRDLAWSLMLHLAGPYVERDGWLLIGDVDARATAAVLSAADPRGLITFEAAEEALRRTGVGESFRGAFVEHFLPLRRTDTGWLRWDGNVLDKIERMLALRGRPATVEQLLDEVGAQRNVNGIRWRMIEDDRFVRINRQNEFALPGWGFDAYTGVVDEIRQELERCGGVAAAEYLIEKISSTYKVAPASVATYLNAPMFVRAQNGAVRLRQEADPEVVIKDDLTCANHCFFHGRRWTLRVNVDADALRGSGRGLPEAFASYMGVTPGTKLQVAGRAGTIRVSWRMTSAFGPDLGSIRDELHHFEAREGDLLFLRYTEDGRFDTWLRRGEEIAGSDPLTRAGLLVGYPGGADVADIARAVGIATDSRDEHTVRSEVENRLLARRDDELLELVRQAPADDDLDAVLRRLGDVLG